MCSVTQVATEGSRRVRLLPEFASLKLLAVLKHNADQI